MIGSVAVITACSAEPRVPVLRQMSQTYAYTITPEYAPPHARDNILYKIQIVDRKTRQPIENGEGQLFASRPIEPNAPTGPHTRTWDGLAYGPEIGTYHAKLNYVIPGQWAVAIRFRRDSLHPLERTDWMQDVLGEKPDSIP
jgi:hypothetical protein